MAEQETSWILSLVDRVSKPIKEIITHVKESTGVIDKNAERVILSEKQTKTALENTKKYYKDVQNQIKENAKEVERLQKEYDKAAPGNSRQAAFLALNKSKRQLEDMRKELKGASQDIKDLSGDLDNYKNKKQTFGGFMTGINQTMEVIEKVSSMFDFAQPIINTRTEIEHMTRAAGKDLDELVGKVHKIGVVFNANDDDIARAANSMQKVWGGSYSEMIDLLQQGYEKGADVNKKLLDSMKEYPAQMKEAGLTAKETIALIAQANKQGIVSDSAIDSIKQADIALKDMNKNTVEALKGLGISAKDLRGKTTFEALQLISEKMKTASTEQRQHALDAIFKLAGKEAGMQFVMGLTSIDLNIENLPNVKQAGAGMRGFFADIQSWAANTFGGMVPYIQIFGQTASGIVGIIGLMQQLSKVTWIQAAASKAAAIAQKIWNATMVNIPIGVMIGGVAALGAAIYGITQLVNRNTDAHSRSEALKEVEQELDKKIIETTAEKTAKIKMLTKVAEDERLSIDARKKALNELIGIDSRYQTALKNDTILTEELRKTTAELTKEIYENAKIKAGQELIVKYEKEKLEAQQEVENNGYDDMNFFQKTGDAVNDMLYGESEWRKKRDAERILAKNPIKIEKLIKEQAEYYANKSKEKPKEEKPLETNPNGTVPVLDPSDSIFDNKKGKKEGSGREKNGLSLSGGAGGTKNITQNLVVNNYFTRNGNSDDRSFADRIITQVNDGLRDALVTL